MAGYLGLDGFCGGWVAAWIDDRGDHGFNYSSSLSRLLSMPHSRAMIDMPIGLKMSGHRTCDIRARELVGASVFLGARRNLWEFPDQATANQYYWRHEGPGMGVSCTGVDQIVAADPGAVALRQPFCKFDKAPVGQQLDALVTAERRFLALQAKRVAELAEDQLRMGLTVRGCRP